MENDVLNLIGGVEQPGWPSADGVLHGLVLGFVQAESEYYKPTGRTGGVTWSRGAHERPHGASDDTRVLDSANLRSRPTFLSSKPAGPIESNLYVALYGNPC